MITLVLADNFPVTRAGLRSILSGDPNIQIVGEAEDGISAQQMVKKLHPRILLLDLRMPGLRPAIVTKWVRTYCPETVILVLTDHDRDSYLVEMIDAGAIGYLTIDESPKRLINAIHYAACGEILFSDKQYARAFQWRQLAGDRLKTLTPRELEILQLIEQGLCNSAIALKLQISLKTVKNHIANILCKLGVNSRQKAVAWFHKFCPDGIAQNTQNKIGI